MLIFGVSNETIDAYMDFIARLRAMRARRPVPTNAPAHPVPTSHLEREQMKIPRKTATKNPRPSNG